MQTASLVSIYKGQATRRAQHLSALLVDLIDSFSISVQFYSIQDKVPSRGIQHPLSESPASFCFMI